MKSLPRKRTTMQPTHSARRTARLTESTFATGLQESPIQAAATLPDSSHDDALARFKNIIACIPGLVFECMLDQQGGVAFTYLNAGCRNLLAIMPEQLYADPQLLVHMILPADRASFLESVREAAVREAAWTWEGSLMMRELHEVKSIRLHATAYRDRNGKVLWSGIMSDITRDMNEKMAMDEISYRFKAIVSNIPSLVFQCYLDDNNAIAFDYLGPRCHALLGIDADTLLSQPHKLLEIIVPEDHESFLTSMQKSAADMTVWNWEGRLWIEEWQDIKLINLRASPVLNAQGLIQWCGVITNITQSKREKQELEESRQQLEELSSHMALIKEQERLHIAREIHDNIGGNLSAIKIGLSSLIKGLSQQHPELLEKASQLEKLVDRTFDDTHRITADLRPGVLELGIVAALEWQSREFEKSTGIRVHFRTNDEDLELDLDRAIVLFRICQEAMTNIAKYARADSVEIDLMHEKDEIVMQIVDNGIGIKPEDKQKKRAFGLRGMHERAQAVGGTLTIEPAPVAGTRVLVRLPDDTTP